MRLRVFWCLIVIALGGAGGCKKKETIERVCGGSINAICPPDKYCELTDGCGGYDREGVCKPRPMKCPEEKEPVCGCDGKSYEGACFAALKGVTVRHLGECEGSVSENEGGEEDEEVDSEVEDSEY